MHNRILTFSLLCCAPLVTLRRKRRTRNNVYELRTTPDQWRRNHGVRGGTCPSPTLQMWGGTGGTICSCTLGKTSNWRTIILNRNYPEFHRLTWQAACVHFIYLFFVNKTTTSTRHTDFLRQHNHDNQYCYWAEIVLLVYVPVSFFTFVKFLNFFSRLL